MATAMGRWRALVGFALLDDAAGLLEAERAESGGRERYLSLDRVLATH